jgi:hypothetical protein
LDALESISRRTRSDGHASLGPNDSDGPERRVKPLHWIDRVMHRRRERAQHNKVRPSDDVIVNVV